MSAAPTANSINVFPASAGVILNTYTHVAYTPSFPRIRGGDPQSVALFDLPKAVFPASAGVILPDIIMLLHFISFPRIRGGDPKGLKARHYAKKFSPHPRG